MKKVKVIEVQVYSSKVTVMVVKDCVKAYNNLLKTYPSIGPAMKESEEHVQALACSDEDNHGLYWMLFEDGYPFTVNAIAHECFHTTLNICENFGVQIDSEAEAPAYLHDYLVKEVAQYLLGPKDDKKVKLQVRVRKSRRVAGKNVQPRQAPRKVPRPRK